MWGALNASGVQFRLSGYRAIGGKDIKPVSDDIEISKGVSIPTTLPLSFVTGVGVDARKEKREASDRGSLTSNGSSIALEDASIFMTSPMGKHFSAFVEFPMYETKSWEFTPTGKFEANNTSAGRHIQFKAENPTFEVAKFFFNNVLGDALPRDSLNVVAGITHLPLGYASGKVRLSVNQYLIYERRALDYISPRKVADVIGGEADDYLFRLGEPQVIAGIFGMTTFAKPVTDVSKRDTLWAEYHLGVTNASNGKADNNTSKAIYGRVVFRYYGQSLGFSGITASDTYDDNLRSNASIAANPTTGIMSGRQDANKMTRLGIDSTLSLAPMGVPVWLENQYVSSKEDNPTGFGREFKWKGGFHQLNWQPSKVTITYARYDYVKGDRFDDSGVVLGGIRGITTVKPEETDYVVGFQHLLDPNIKLIGEYRHHRFEDKAGLPVVARLTDDGFTLRIMLGF
jgi:hypothetical protein